MADVTILENQKRNVFFDVVSEPTSSMVLPFIRMLRV